MDETKKLFKMFDKNKDEMITLSEFKNVLMN